jgi:hypothetical protein
MVLSRFWDDWNSTFWVTFISVPGSWRSNGEQFKYFQFVLGNAIGFIIIAKYYYPCITV